MCKSYDARAKTIAPLVRIFPQVHTAHINNMNTQAKFLFMLCIISIYLVAQIVFMKTEICVPKGTIDPNCSPQDKWCKICK